VKVVLNGERALVEFFIVQVAGLTFRRFFGALGRSSLSFNAVVS
jgi:hypothetical protein